MSNNKQTVKSKILVTGVFDLLHYEHINFLQKAKALGDYLIVGIESDVRVRQLKGENRPINNQESRIQNLELLSIADEVFVLPANMGEKQIQQNLIKKIKPQFLAVSSHTPFIAEKRKIIEKYGGKLVVVHQQNPKISTSKLLLDRKNGRMKTQ
jgi:D-glycero-beta-D-manno-heptose 1-phosphate adenylyltransferase